MSQSATPFGSRTPTIVADESRRPSSSSTSEKPQPAPAASPDAYLVKFDEGDPENPQNWSDSKRWLLTALGAILVLNATFASSAPSGIIPLLMRDFNMGREVGVLTISLFVAGYCVGPLLWGPLSEVYGRRPIFLVSFFVYTIFQMACAVANNTTAMLFFRFIGGTFAAAPLTNSGALISDIWDARTRGRALAFFTLAPFAGPALGPTVAGFIAVGVKSTSYASWRYLFWVLFGFAAICFVAIVIALPETYAPVLLVRKAERLRKETGDERYYAPLERQNVTFGQRIENTLKKPFVVLFQEPMLAILTLYMSFVYGCLYLLFEAYPVIFTKGHGFNAGISGLMFLPLPIGGALGVFGYLIYYNPKYVKAVEQYAPNPVPPEFRLEMAIIAAPIFTISFFWVGWTSYPSVHWAAPMTAGLAIGFSISWIFLSLFNYIIDVYLFVAATALAANTVVRSLFGAVFPLFGGQMYDALGAQWASSLVGFVALAMTPVPFVLVKYGPALRQRSKHAPTLPPAAPITEKTNTSSA